VNGVLSFGRQVKETDCMICKKCGKELKDGVKFCTSCGWSVTEEALSNANTVKKEKKGGKIALISVGVLLIAALAIGSSVLLAKKLVKDRNEVIYDAEKTEETGEDGGKESEEIKNEEAGTEEAAAKPETDIEKIMSLERPLMLKVSSDESKYYDLKPSVPEITVEKDFSNVINGEEFSWQGEDFVNQMVEDQFVVIDGGGNEFFETYEFNRYSLTPNFVTVDSMMHSYHIYFSHLLKTLERERLSEEIKTLSETMYKVSCNQLDEVKGSEFEDAAKRNVAFFGVGCELLGVKTDCPQEVNDIVKKELALIKSASGVDKSPLLNDYEDYTQYKPRGYYEGDENLEKYFRAMMWYGRIQFTQEKEDMDRSALLMTLAIDEAGFDKWEGIMSITSFFAGASDDLGYYEYMPVIEAVYGKSATLSQIAGDKDKWKEFHKLTAKLEQPRINSIPIEEGEDNVILGYRFMGQRFTIDATIMQELIYSRVEEKSKNGRRMLPDVLDVPAALGSEEALNILEESGVTDYRNYSENMKNLRKEFNNDDSSIWQASLYAGWLNTLRPLLTEKGKGYPTFMQSQKWIRKTLETFAGSYTELKHDTILYAKQVLAEMGGGWEEEVDDRGYVEPEPLVYLRFAKLAQDTADGLEKYGYLKSEDKENLNNLSTLAKSLETISVKELNNELLTDEEYDLIRDYGGQIEHLWYEVMRAESGEDYVSTDEYPAALVVDVATDPNGSVLELANDNPATIYVAVAVDGKIRICRGSVYSFYQFEQPLDERLTDSDWRKMRGIIIDDYENPDKDIVEVEHPDWTKDYRYTISYNY